MHRGQRILEIARMRRLAVVILHEHPMLLLDTGRTLGIANVAAEPLRFAAPVNVVIRLPRIFAAAGEAEGFEAHRLQRDVAGENQQVGPRNFASVLLFDRPEKPARLVEAHVVRPAVERREALLPATRAAATIAGAIRARAVPRHADEERAVMTEVRRPPLLRVSHQLREILLQRREVQALELLRVIEARAHRVGLGGMLVQQLDLELVRPPVVVRGAAADKGRAVAERTARFSGHVFSP